jgi:hypothetical protein
VQAQRQDDQNEPTHWQSMRKSHFSSNPGGLGLFY